MMSTADKVLSAWVGHKKQHDGTYRGNCPYRPGSDSNGFVLAIDDGEHGAYTDHAGKESGSLYDLAKKLNIDLPENGKVQVASTKRKYENLDDYASQHYAPLEAFELAGWHDTDYHGKPAIAYPVQSGVRYRLLTDEDKKSPYRWDEKGRTNCWYGLQRAINMAHKQALPLVLCNGEASTIVGQHHGIPAFSGTGGEGAISDEMLAELKERWNGKVYIALDCDRAGQDAAASIKQDKLQDAMILDLGLTDSGDLADFCGIHQQHAMSALKRIANVKLDNDRADIQEMVEFVDGDDLLRTFQEFIFEDPSLFGRVVRMPFQSMRASGGFADMMTTKKLWLIGNVSGGGKTILSECLADGWNELGYNVVYIGDEWSPMELTARRIQRATPHNQPVTYMDFLAYTDGKREMTADDTQKVALGTRHIRMREGRTYYMQVDKHHRDEVFLEDILGSLGRKVDGLKANGVRVDVVILDYLSLYNTRSDTTGNNVEEYKVGVFKSWCRSLDVLGVSTVQVKKDAEERVKHQGGYLTQHDLYYIRPDKGNLITTMNRVYRTRYEVEDMVQSSDNNAFKPYLDENGNAEATPNFCMVTAKNSVATPNEYTFFHFDFDHLKICEGLHPDYMYSVEMGIVLPKFKERNTVDLSNL